MRNSKSGIISGRGSRRFGEPLGTSQSGPLYCSEDLGSAVKQKCGKPGLNLCLLESVRPTELCGALDCLCTRWSILLSESDGGEGNEAMVADDTSLSASSD